MNPFRDSGRLIDLTILIEGNQYRERLGVCPELLDWWGAFCVVMFFCSFFVYSRFLREKYTSNSGPRTGASFCHPVRSTCSRLSLYIVGADESVIKACGEHVRSMLYRKIASPNSATLAARDKKIALSQTYPNCCVGNENVSRWRMMTHYLPRFALLHLIRLCNPYNMSGARQSFFLSKGKIRDIIT